MREGQKSLLLLPLMLPLLLLSACSPRINGVPPVEFTRQDTQTLVMTGYLAYGAAGRFQKMWTPETTTLILNNAVTLVDEQLRLGQFLRDKNLSVEVKGACLAGCASYLFLPASRKRIAPGGVVGFEGSLTSNDQAKLRRLYDEKFGLLPLETERWLAYGQELIPAEQALLSPAALRLLADADRMVNRYREENHLDLLKDDASALVFWTPATSELNCYGVGPLAEENAVMTSARREEWRRAGVVLFESIELKNKPREVSSCVR